MARQPIFSYKKYLSKYPILRVKKESDMYHYSNQGG